MPAGQFQTFGPSHIAVLLITAATAACLTVLARRGPRAALSIDLTLGVFLLFWQVASRVVQWRLGWLTKEDSLPFHLCDIAAFTGAFALLFRNPLLAELTWFWGLSGTLNGLVTPDLADDFPSYAFIGFFVLHGMVVVTAVYLVAGRGYIPRPGAVWRVFLWSQVYLVFAFLANWLADTNYGYLRGKPATPSLLDHMGDWPWYILGLEVLALVFYTVLYLPFLPYNRRQRLSGTAKVEEESSNA